MCSYQRILHRDLMEMAEFTDSMFGVYSNTYSNIISSSVATSNMVRSMEGLYIVHAVS